MRNNDEKTLRLRDLPSIHEVEERFEQKRSNLRRIGVENAEEVVRLRNYVALKFVFKNFELVERKDRELAYGTMRKAWYWGAGVLVVPSLINFRLGKLTGDRIYGMHYLVRGSFRISFYAFPLFFWVDYFVGAYAKICLYLADKYADRVEVYMKLKDPKILNPYSE